MALSVLIPSRNEPYLAATARSLLEAAVGDIEVLVVFDGANGADVSLPDDSRVRVIRHETPHGMRQSINEAVSVARGEYLLKCDAHVLFAPRFDEVLLQEIADDWIVVPRRYTLDVDTWSRVEADTIRDAHHFTFPFHDPTKPPLLRGLTWKERAAQRLHVLLDDEMTSQGSCWVMSRRHWDRIGPLDFEHYGPFIQEFQELGNKTWLSGGAVKVNKRTWYAHWYKRTGQGYALSRRQSREGIAYSFRHWFYDEPWPGKVRSFDWLIDHFWPIPTWPDDWRERREASRAG